jgi:hypothetical protein
MSFRRWLNFKKIALLMLLFLSSSMVAVSDQANDFSDSSSYDSPIDILIYGLVGSNLLRNE